MKTTSDRTSLTSTLDSKISNMPRKGSRYTSDALALKRPVRKSFSIARENSLVETHEVPSQEESDDADWTSIFSSSVRTSICSTEVEQIRQTAGSVSFLEGAKPSLCEPSSWNKINWNLSDEELEFLPIQASTPKKKKTSISRRLFFSDSSNKEDLSTSKTSDLSDEELEFLPVQSSIPMEKETSTEHRTLVFCDSYNEETSPKTSSSKTSTSKTSTSKTSTSKTSDLSDEELETLPLQTPIPKEKEAYTKDRAFDFCTSYSEEYDTTSTTPEECECCELFEEKLPNSRDESKKLLEYGRELQDLQLVEKRVTPSLKDQEISQNSNKASRKHLYKKKKIDNTSNLLTQDVIERNQAERKKTKIATCKSAKSLEKYEHEFRFVQASTPKEKESYIKDRTLIFSDSNNEETSKTSDLSDEELESHTLQTSTLKEKATHTKDGTFAFGVSYEEGITSSKTPEQKVMQNYNKALTRYLNESKKTDDATELLPQDTIKRNKLERKKIMIARSKSSKNLEKYDGDKHGEPHLEITSFPQKVVNEDLYSQKKQSKKPDRRKATRCDHKSVEFSKEFPKAHSTPHKGKQQGKKTEAGARTLTSDSKLTLLKLYRRKMAKVPICDIITTKCGFP